VCVGKFTATVNGVRTTSPSADSADISFATSDGAINAWGDFAGSARTLGGIAQTEEVERQPVQVEARRGAIVGAETDGSWHWATGNPPGDTIPAVFLAVGLVLLLLRVHRTVRQRVLSDFGQAAVAAAGCGLLVYGYWFGLLPILAVLGWMAWRAWRTRRSPGWLYSSPAPTQFPPDDESDAGPGRVDRADFVIHEAGGQGDFSHNVVRHLGRDAGGALRPADPEAAGRL